VLSVAIGRAGFGAEQALSSRYTSFSLYFYIGLYLANVPKTDSEKSTFDRIVISVLLTILYLSVIFAYTQSTRIGRQYLVSHSYMVYLLRNYDLVSDDDLLNFHPNSKKVREVAEMLAKRRWNAFRNAAVHENPLAGERALSKKQSLPFNKNIFRITEKAVVIEGTFILDPDNGRAADAVYIRIIGKYYPAFYVERWDDMTDYFQNSRLKYSGYFSLLPRDTFFPGLNPIEIIVLTKDRQTYYTSKIVMITIPINDQDTIN